MDKYSEYTGFRKDNEKLLSKLRRDNTSIYDYFLDTFKILGHIELQANIGEVDNDLEEIFDGAFPFLFENFETVKIFLKEIFKNDYDEFIKYDKIVVYYLFLEDLQLSLEEKKKNHKFIPKIDEILREIDNVLINRKPVEGLKEELDLKVGAIGITDYPKSMKEIMEIIAEELKL